MACKIIPSLALRAWKEKPRDELLVAYFCLCAVVQLVGLFFAGSGLRVMLFAFALFRRREKDTASAYSGLVILLAAGLFLAYCGIGSIGGFSRTGHTDTGRPEKPLGRNHWDRPELCAGDCTARGRLAPLPCRLAGGQTAGGSLTAPRPTARIGGGKPWNNWFGDKGATDGRNPAPGHAQRTWAVYRGDRRTRHAVRDRGVGPPARYP